MVKIHHIFQPMFFRNKLPQLNWSALKPNQVKETVFNELDDEKIIDVLYYFYYIKNNKY